MTEDRLKGKLSGTRLVEGAFAEDEELSEITLPKDLEDIGEVAFFGCGKLREIGLPMGLRTIREEAFGESGLIRVVIPETVEMVEEKAFFSCPELQRADVLSKDTVLGRDVFGDCPKLLEGYIACGYPKDPDPPEELLYTLLWCTCPERHSAETTAHAEKYVRDNEALIMERILKFNNVAAMSGIAERQLLKPENIGQYVEMAGRMKRTELVTLLVGCAGALRPGAEDWDEFAL